MVNAEPVKNFTNICCIIKKGNFMKWQLFILVLAAGICCTAAMSQPNESGNFLTLLGRDTIAVEEFSFGANGFHGTSVVRAPRTSLREYTATFGPGGVLQQFHITYQRYGGQVYAERTYTYTDDSIHVSVKQDTSVNNYVVATAGRPYPFFADIFGAWQATLQRALMPDGKKEFDVVAGRQLLHYKVQQGEGGKIDLLNVGSEFGPIHVEMGEGNQLQKFDLTETTDKFIGQRVAALDVEGLAKNFAEREKSGNALGTLSPRDSTRTMIGAASVIIDYGRPSARGRKIFGGIVPWNVVWRTGANAATQLITDKDLSIGGTFVPAGTYSLFTLPKEDGWMLIINRQHGQWGTDYDQTKDLARVPLQVKHIDAPVEKFTIDLMQEGSGGMIDMKWENTEASVTFVVK
ncbi:MAG TPA: DUF2911 domain-containing protein [Bacteroidota bacterium]|nr:DUF2911 domain-containing protein [Bacteroidota bacterium]